MSRRAKLALLLAAATLTACGPLPAVAPEASGPSTRPAAARSARVTLAGQLRIPASLALGPGVRLVSDRGAGVVAAGSNIIGIDGGTLVSDRGAGLGSGYALSAIPAAGVEGARVFLADVAGQPLPDLPEVKTDGQARFHLPRVPAEATFVVIAEVPTGTGAIARFRTVVRVGRFGATTVIDPASTLVTASVLEGLPRGELGELNPAKFQSATEATARNMTAQNLPDFTDSASVKASMDVLVSQVRELRDVVGELRTELAALRSSLETLRAGAPQAPSVAPEAPAAPGSPTPRPPAEARCDEPTSYMARIADPRVWALEVRERRPGGEPGQGELLHRGVRDGELLYLHAPVGCAVELVYQDEAGNRLGLVSYTFPAQAEGAGPLALPEPPLPSQVPTPTPSQSPGLSPTPTPSQSPTTSPQPTPSQSPTTSPSPNAKPCSATSQHQFRVVNATANGRAAEARIVIASVASWGFTASVSSTTMATDGFTMVVPEGCPLTIRVLNASEQLLKELVFSVPVGSKGRVHQLAI
ncbi:MAG: hypothetical protein VKS61_14360 [Candidatus Sericytochromatia bacterium]|nr:hypothetical protein [Candidatus Sericytochromatia bacterium]